MGGQVDAFLREEVSNLKDSLLKLETEQNKSKETIHDKNTQIKILQDKVWLYHLIVHKRGYNEV